MTDRFDQMIAMLRARFGIADDQLRPVATLNDLGFDSLDYVTLAMALQKEFGVEVDADELLPEDSLASVERLLTTKVDGAADGGPARHPTG
jgi:acyl carrier protein